MTWIEKMFLLALKLYPRPFRARFASEMEEVFHIGLEEACKEGGIVSFILSELLRLPTNLIGVYMWSIQVGEKRQVAVSSVGGGGSVGVPMPGEGWGASLMADLPHLLMGIIIVSSTIIGAMDGINQEAFGYLLMIVISLLLSGVLISVFTKVGSAGLPVG